MERTAKTAKNSKKNYTKPDMVKHENLKDITLLSFSPPIS
jgi:hypothetical protein